jgi:hypothetical protein
MRRYSRTPDAAVDQLYRAVERGQAAHLEFVDHLDADALRACRALSHALRRFDPDVTTIATAVGDRLAELLNATPLDGAADPFLALVHGGADEVPWRRARASAGDAYVERFLRSLSSKAPETKADVRRAVTDRSELERLFREAGLVEHAHRLAHEVAADAIVVEPLDRPGARSRFGGPPLLPAGTPWPEPLAFLAAIDLSELPASRLPRTGWLLFFAGDEDGIWDDSPMQVFATDAPVEVERRPSGLRECGLAFHAVLSLPGGFDAPAELGLDAAEGQAYEELRERLAAALPAGSDLARHWIGGHATGVQGFTPEPDTTLLLHLEDDDELGLSIADAGTLQFRIPDAALAAGDWSRITTVIDSC